MKILIAYDGSEGSKAAIEDLRISGLPSSGVDAQLLCVGDYNFSSDVLFYADSRMPIGFYTPERVSAMNKQALGSATLTAEDGLRGIKEIFPGWQIHAMARMNSPASTILDIANEWKPDLLVMGSHGRSALGRLFMGSVSLRVVNEAMCSVRVVKHTPRAEVVSNNSALKIMLCFDGSEGSLRAANVLKQRLWPSGTALTIIAVADTSMLESIYSTLLVSADSYDQQSNGETKIEELMRSIEMEMKKYFQTATTSLMLGSPTGEIISEAKRLKPDMIFIGSNGNAKLKRNVGTIIPMLGSVAHGVSVYATATVEVVR